MDSFVGIAFSRLGMVLRVATAKPVAPRLRSDSSSFGHMVGSLLGCFLGVCFGCSKGPRIWHHSWMRCEHDGRSHYGNVAGRSPDGVTTKSALGVQHRAGGRVVVAVCGRQTSSSGLYPDRRERGYGHFFGGIVEDHISQAYWRTVRIGVEQFAFVRSRIEQQGSVDADNPRPNDSTDKFQVLYEHDGLNKFKVWYAYGNYVDEALRQSYLGYSTYFIHDHSPSRGAGH
jgi:hypothetical protein